MGANSRKTTRDISIGIIKNPSRVQVETMTDDLFTPIEIQSIKSKIDFWLQNQIDKDAVIKSADYDINESRWYVRVTGEEKQHYMILLTLRQRTLHFETYVMPEPEENKEDFYLSLIHI